MLFSVVATLFQWCLHLSGFLEGPELAVKTNFAAAILLGAGVYQFLPIKNACLSRCRSPLSFLLDHWSGVERNAFTVGLRHGPFQICHNEVQWDTFVDMLDNRERWLKPESKRSHYPKRP